MTNRKIQLHLPYIDHRGNQYPADIYDENALPERVKELSENKMTIYNGNEKLESAVEEKELYEGKREQDVKVKTKEVRPKQSKTNKKSPKKQDQTPKEQNPTKTHKVNKIEEEI